MALTLLAATTEARADEATRPLSEAIRLGPSRCLNAKRIAEHTRMWLQRSDVDRRILVEVADAPEGVRFVVRRDGRVLGERTLEVKKIPCEEIHAALGLGIAAAIDATLLPGLGVPAPAPAAPPPPRARPAQPAPVPPPVIALPAPPAPPAPAPPAPTPPPAQPPRGKASIVTATVQEIVLVNVLPKVALGAAPSAELTVMPRLELRVAAFVTGTTTVAVGVGTADVALFGGLLDACAATTALETWRLRACGGVVLGAVRAAGSGFPDSKAATSPWIAPNLRVDGRWSVTRAFGLVVGVDGFIPGLRPELQFVDGGGNVIVAKAFPFAGVGISLGPSLTF